ncbi:MAG: PHP domain-containing protein [Chlamydiales bacterium]|nr:PHP domain-containing protein [Chlamydiales bacterium]
MNSTVKYFGYQMKYDLHCHSIYSDGSLTPRELIALAQEKELSGISITDHDALQGFYDAEHLGFPILPGVELSADFENTSIHVLGYAFSPKDPEFLQFCLQQRVWRLERLKAICDNLTKNGTPISYEEVVTVDDPSYTYGRVHIALQLIKNGYVKNVPEAFKRYIGDKSPNYVSGKKCSVQEAIDAIHKAKGFAVLAHPHLIDSKSMARRLIALNFDGIEAHYARFVPNVNDAWVQKAKARGMFVTGGSDFHGLPKPESHLGSASCPQDVFEKLYTHYLSHIS